MGAVVHPFCAASCCRHHGMRRCGCLSECVLVELHRNFSMLFSAHAEVIPANRCPHAGDHTLSAYVEVILKKTTKIIPCQTRWQGIRPTFRRKYPSWKKIITTTLGVALIISNALPAPIELTLMLYAAFAMAVGYGLRNIPHLYKELKAV